VTSPSATAWVTWWLAGEDVVDQLAAAAVDPGIALWFRDSRGEVPQSLPVALIGLVEAAGADLGARWAVQDLGSRCFGFVVQVAGVQPAGGRARTSAGAAAGEVELRRVLAAPPPVVRVERSVSGSPHCKRRFLTGPYFPAESLGDLSGLQTRP
jgi:hypothetical protein